MGELTSRRASVVCLLAVAGMATSCGSTTRADAASYAGPLRSRDLERGGQIFRTFCSPCHAGRVSPEGYLWSPAQMRRQIREGNRAMPAIRTQYLSDDDMEAVLAFLTVIGAVDAPLPLAVDGDEVAPPPEELSAAATPRAEEPPTEEPAEGSPEPPSAAGDLGDPRGSLADP